jgi:hypothetical protein
MLRVVLLLLVLLLLPSNSNSSSATAVATPAAYYQMTNACEIRDIRHPTDPLKPEADARGVEVGTGVYNVTICNTTAWTFRSLWHSENVVLSATGFAQTVSNVNLPNRSNAHDELWPPLRPLAASCPVIQRPLCPPPKSGAPVGSCNGFLGTGHGGEYVYAVTLHTPGGKEQVDLLAAPAAAKQSWSTGGSISVVKQSQIGAYLATQNVTLDPVNGMTVTANYTLAFDNVNKTSVGHINWFYPCMSMFALPFKRWVAVTANGTQLSGTFSADDSMTLQQDIRWAAVYDEDSARGAVYQYPVGHAYKGRHGAHNEFWNRAYDHKLYHLRDISIMIGNLD